MPDAATSTAAGELDVLVDELAPPDEEQVRVLETWWRACNYLTIGQIYRRDNPLLQEPLKPADGGVWRAKLQR